MFAHQRFGACAFLGFDRVQHAFVLIVGDGQQAPRFRQVPVAMLDAIVGVVHEIATRLGLASPNIDALLGLTRVFARRRGLYPA